MGNWLHQEVPPVTVKTKALFAFTLIIRVDPKISHLTQRFHESHTHRIYRGLNKHLVLFKQIPAIFKVLPQEFCRSIIRSCIVAFFTGLDSGSLKRSIKPSLWHLFRHDGDSIGLQVRRHYRTNRLVQLDIRLSTSG